VTQLELQPVLRALRACSAVLFASVLELPPLHWLTLAQFLVESSISPKNKAAIQEALQDAQPLDDCTRIIWSTAKARCFVKRDKDKPGFRPRNISGMEPLVTAILGPPISTIQKAFEEGMDGRFFFAAGKTSEDLSRWKKTVPLGYVPLATDQKNFDALMKEPWVDVVMYIYSLVFKKHELPNKKNIMALLHYQKRTMGGKTSQGNFWGIRGTMKSGSSDTCLANSLVNLVVTLYSLAISCQTNMTTLVLEKLVWIAVMGDDDSIFYSPTLGVDLALFQRTMEDLGMEVKLQSANNDCEIFLNMLPLKVKGGEVYTPLLGRSLARLFTTLSQPSDHLMHIAGVVEAMWPSVEHHLIWDAWLRRMWELTRGHHRAYYLGVEKELSLKYKVLARCAAEGVPRTTEQICHRYSISEKELEQALVFLSNLQLDTDLDDCPILTRIMDVDLEPLVL
jgi:hypothetical protein